MEERGHLPEEMGEIRSDAKWDDRLLAVGKFDIGGGEI